MFSHNGHNIYFNPIIMLFTLLGILATTTAKPNITQLKHCHSWNSLDDVSNFFASLLVLLPRVLVYPMKTEEWNNGMFKNESG